MIRLVSDSEQADSFSDSHAYWNGEGGRKWVSTMDDSEANFARMSAALMAKANPHPGEKVLDIGCGGGVTSLQLAEQVSPEGEVLGLDISAVILDVARQRHGKVAGLSFSQADATDAPLTGQHYDLIFSRLGVMFFAEPVKAFANLRQALTPNGRLVFMCWRSVQENTWMVKPTVAAIELLDEQQRPPPPADPRAPGPFALADADYIDEILTAAGFTTINVEPLDSVMQLGKIDNALHYLKAMGPLAQIIPELAPEKIEQIEAAMAAALQPYATDTSLDLPSASWIVTATP